jgi:hypothetical protein
VIQQRRQKDGCGRLEVVRVRCAARLPVITLAATPILVFRTRLLPFPKVMRATTTATRTTVAALMVATSERGAWLRYRVSLAPELPFVTGRRGSRLCKTKTDLAVNKFCKIQTSKPLRFEPRLGFLARFAQFAKVPSVFFYTAPVATGQPGPMTRLPPAGIQTIMPLPASARGKIAQLRTAIRHGDRDG